MLVHSILIKIVTEMHKELIPLYWQHHWTASEASLIYIDKARLKSWFENYWLCEAVIASYLNIDH